MKLKILYPIALIILLIILASSALVIYTGLIETNINVLIIASSIGLFFLILGILLGFKIYSLSKSAISKNAAFGMFKTWLVFVLILLNIFTFIFLANRLYFRLDCTREKNYSISKPTKELLTKLDNTMVIEYFYNDKCKEHAQQAQIVQYVIDILKEYERSSKGFIDFRVTELSYKKHKGKIADLEQKGIMPFQIGEGKEDESTILKGISGVIINYKDKEKVIPRIQFDRGLEFMIDLEIQKMTEEIAVGLIFSMPDKTLQKDYQYVDQILRNEYNSVEIIESGQPIPANVGSILLIGGNGLTEYDLFKIDQFIMNGGKILALINGVDVVMNPQYGLIFGVPSDNPVIDMFASYGIKINRNIVGDHDSYNPMPYYEKGFPMPRRYPVWPRISVENINTDLSMLEPLQMLSFFWPASIDIDEKIKNNSTSLFHTTENSWAETQNFRLDIQTFELPIQEAQGEFNLGYEFKGKLESYFKNKDIPKIEGGEFLGSLKESGDSHLIVIGNNVFLQTQFLQSDYAGGNEIFLFTNAMGSLSRDQSLIEIRSKGQLSRPLDKPRNRSERNLRKNIIIGITTYVIPLIIIIIGIIINLLRYFYNKKIKYSFKKN